MVVAAVDYGAEFHDVEKTYSSGRMTQSSFNVVKDDYEPQLPGLLKGTGGAVTVYFNQTPSGSGVFVEIVKGNSLALAVDKVINTFGLTKEQLAEIIGSTRKTIYNWIEGSSTPRSSSLDRIHDLQMAANEWTKSGLPVPKDHLRTPVIDGKSLLELMQDGANQDLLLFAGTRLTLQHTSVKSLSDPFA